MTMILSDKNIDSITSKAMCMLVKGNIVIISSSFYRKLKGKYKIIDVFPLDNLVSLKKMDAIGKNYSVEYWTLLEDIKRYLSENISYIKVYKPKPTPTQVKKTSKSISSPSHGPENPSFWSER